MLLEFRLVLNSVCFYLSVAFLLIGRLTEINKKLRFSTFLVEYIIFKRLMSRNLMKLYPIERRINPIGILNGCSVSAHLSPKMRELKEK